MKYLKTRYIFTFSLILILGVVLLIFFFGGLRASALQDTNEPFSLDGYVDYFNFDENGIYTASYNSEDELNQALTGFDPSSYRNKVVDNVNNVYSVQFLLNENKIVGQNEQFTMFLNEKTTNVTVAFNESCQAPSGKTLDGFDNYKINTCTKKYESAKNSGISSEERSNLILNYVASNGKLAAIPYNTFKNSIQYEDLLLGKTLRYYQIKVDSVNNSVEILYKLGDFTVINSYFPIDFKRSDMEDYFVGNLVFKINPTKVRTDSALVYTGAFTTSKECAAYLEEKELAKVTPFYNNVNSKLDEFGNPIPARYDLSDIFEKDDQDRPLNKLKMQIGIDYNANDFNAEGASPCIANPFSNYVILDNILNGYYKLQGISEDEETNYDINWDLSLINSSPTYQLKASGSLEYKMMFEYFYKIDDSGDRNYYYYDIKDVTVTEENRDLYLDLYPNSSEGQVIKDAKIPVLYDENPYDSVKGVPFIIGGFQARDEQGNFEFEDDGRPKQEIFTKDKADAQNDLYGNEVESNAPIFQVAMRLTLTDKGLETTILNNSFKEGLGKNYRDKDGKSTEYSHDCLLGEITVLPYLSYNDLETSQGQIILPDGSGAIISFNSPKDELGYKAYEKPIYGLDKAFVSEITADTDTNEKFMFGMYGFLDKTQGKGVLAIADKGASESYIYANFKRANLKTTKNIAYFIARLRERETVYVGPYNSPFLKWSKDYMKSDIKYIYQFLKANEFIATDGSIQYVTLASKYREYLVDKYGLTPQDNTSNNVVNLNFLGAFEKRQVALGFARNVDYSLTTFEQAEEIIRELQEEGIDDFNVAYTGWTNEALEPKANSSIRASSVLGNRRGLIKFNEFLQDNSINLYPSVSTASNKGYDFSFGNLKYTAKSVSSSYAMHYNNTLFFGGNNKTEPLIMISPKYYSSLITKQMKSINQLKLNSVFLNDLGNQRIGDYSRDNIIYAEDGANYQINALEIANKENSKVMLSAPFDYALKYADFAVDVPLESTLLGYYDYSIPFYQLVVSGLFDYTGPAVNFDSEHSVNWYLLKSLETGSNLSFMVSYEDTKTLLNTDYTMYFNAFFKNWKSEIVRMNDIINSTKIHNGVLIDHKILRDNVYQVEYNNGTVLIVNYNNTTYYDLNTGLSVRPNWFTVLKEGN